MARRQVLLLAAAVTDATFARQTIDGAACWVGKCIHCNTKLVVGDDGRARGEATLEHIWPETQGGTNALDNLAIACNRCNRQKGSRHDHTKTAKLVEIADALKARRMARWRDPAAVGMAARLVSVYPSVTPDDDDP